MDKNVKIISIKNAIEIITNMSYGSINVKYSDADAAKKTHRLLEVINIIMGDSMIREAACYEDDWNEVEVPGVYRIIYAGRNIGIPAVTEADLIAFDAPAHAKENQCQIVSGANPLLAKKMRKLCSKAGVKLSVSEQGFVIDGRGRAMSISKQIQAAYERGDTSISFTSDEVNSMTVRTYASSLGSILGQKFTCSAAPGKITIHLRDISREDRFVNEVSRIIDEFADVDTITLLRGIEGILPEPHWRKEGFDSENEYITRKIDEAVTRRMVDEYQKHDHIEVVDGMRQYTMNELKQQADSKNGAYEF